MRVVLTSVHYGDHLAVTLPAWLAALPAGTDLIVATSPDDEESQRVALAHGVHMIVTDAWTQIGADHAGDTPTFNMGHGLNVAFGLAGDLMPAPKDGEILGHVNPDCYPFGAWPDDQTFDRDAVYGFWRHECLSPKALREHIDGRRGLDRFPRLKNSHGWPIGYCQFFRAQPGRLFPSYPTAGKFDTAFSRGFSRQVMLDGLYLLHLGPINVRANWAGRVVPRWGNA